MGVTYQVAAKTDVGCVRQNNEDNFAYDERHGIYIVCDGMGGQQAGEVASRMAVETVLRYFREEDGSAKLTPPIGTVRGEKSPRANALMYAIQLANREVHQAGSRQGERHGMGSTIAAVLTQDDFYSIAHVGDSRIYLVRGHEIRQLTQDHSLVMEQVRRGLITREQAETSNMQNIIVRALGSEDSVKPDAEDMLAQPGDILLLATDGLTKHLRDERLLEILDQSPSLEHACDELVQAARDKGGDDNITCLLLRAVSRPWYSAVFSGGKPAWRSSF